MASALTGDEKGIYVELAGIPTYSSARFLSEKVISVTSAAKDHTRNVKRTSTKTLFIPSAAEDEVIASTPQDVSSEVRASIISPSGRFTVILRETGDGSNQKRFVEIWENGKLLVSEDISKLHGVFYTDDYLSSLAFSPSETSVVYTAEANTPETSDDPYARFRFAPDFGESLTGRKRPILVVFRWDSANSGSTIGSLIKGVAKTLNVPEDLSSVLFGQAVFSLDDHIIATGYKYTDDGQLLGVKGCWNRPADLWDLHLSSSSAVTADEDSTLSETITISSWTKISDPGRSSRSPRVHVDSFGLRTLFWLSNQPGGAHCSCTSLHSLVLQGTQQTKTLLDTIDKPSPSFLSGFAGLYTEYRLLERPFLHLGQDKKPFIVVQTAVGSRTAVILVDARKSSTVKFLTPASDDAISSWSVLDTDGNNRILCTRSSPTEPHELLIGTVKLDNDDANSVVSWRAVDKPIIPDVVRKALNSLKVSIIQVPNRAPAETILMEHKAKDNDGVKPLVTSVHGGPHGTSFTSFTPSITALALVGYTVSLPNYTGSLGFGDHYVKKLLGECGTLDVGDVVESVRHLVKLGMAEDNPKKLFVAGGSHGGFIGAHREHLTNKFTDDTDETELITVVGQYPDLFGAAVLRNPVITGAAPASTDIPDWYFWEFGIPYPPGTQATPDLYQKLWDMSPIAHAEKVKAPVLLHIGDSDRRVVNVQGKTFYHALKARRVRTDMLEFKGEGHPLEGVEAARALASMGKDVDLDTVSADTHDSRFTLVCTLSIQDYWPDDELLRRAAYPAGQCQWSGHFTHAAASCNYVVHSYDALDPVYHKNTPVLDAPICLLHTQVITVNAVGAPTVAPIDNLNHSPAHLRRNFVWEETNMSFSENCSEMTISHTSLVQSTLTAIDRPENSIDRKKAIEVADQQLEELLRATLALRKHRNNVVLFIARLPPEVMAHIFSFSILVDPVQLCLPFKASIKQMQLALGWIKVTHVCQRWRQIALSNHALWAHLPCLSPEWCRVAIARARPFPFIIRAELNDNRSHRAEAAVSEAYFALFRTKELDLTADPSTLRTLVDKPIPSAPSLKAIRLRATSGLLRFPQTTLNIMLPSLSNLELINCYFCWSLPIYRSELLVHLLIRLPRGQADTLPTMEQLLDILQTAPALQRLSLVNACPPAPERPEAVTVSRIITVPQLSLLMLTSFSILPCSYLLAHLRLPAEASVYVHRGSISDPHLPLSLPWLMTPCVSRDPGVRPITALSIFLAKGARTDLVFAVYDADTDPFDAHMSAYRYNVTFACTPDDRKFWKEVTLLCSALPTHNIETLILVGARSAKVSWWHSAFGGMKNVRTVLQRNPQRAGKLFSALTTRMSPAPDGPVLFPQLETLAYREGGDFTTVGEFSAGLLTRAKMGYPVKKLQFLDPLVDESVRDELRKVVPQVV
ncbi:hypothetical protein EVG20_g5316 [Dentipellis fragilis]|uniref:acylaminoacyl-peptidase n=1 Tax=Dentipellis fragilis TaxID=205917 RepID=A0A4Y9YTQ7_9AGAM|nr:hypothetical protein EVG20_g5316 [Dentipellis fragilis]